MFRTYTPRDDDYMNRLEEVIADEYRLQILEITPAKRGYYGETWKVKTPDTCYFAKLDYFKRHQALFKNSLPVVHYLSSNGIDFISKVMKTCKDKLFVTFNSAILGVFEWIDGENLETDDTKAHEYQMLCDVYRLTKQGFNIPIAEFSEDAANRFYEKWERLKTAPSNKANDDVLLILKQHENKLHHCFSRLSLISRLCRSEPPEFYLTHGDAGGNFLVSSGRFFIVDWDEVMYAPLERDAWVMSCRPWAVKLFNNTLERSRIPYKLHPKRLAFYCYFMFFSYLNEFMDDFAAHGQTHEIKDYLSGSWIWERIKYADSV